MLWGLGVMRCSWAWGSRFFFAAWARASSALPVPGGGDVMGLVLGVGNSFSTAWSRAPSTRSVLWGSCCGAQRDALVLGVGTPFFGDLAAGVERTARAEGSA